MTTISGKPEAMPKQKKRGPKPEGGVGRVRLLGAGGPWVSRDTLAVLRKWRETYNMPIGRCLDFAVEHASKCPDFYLEVEA